MSANWEYAVSEARGEYVTVLGDDDGLMPHALRELHRLVREHGHPPAIQWNRGIYTWPTIAVPKEANLLHLPIARHYQWRQASDVIREVSGFRLGADFLPMIYNSIIHRDLIAEHRRRIGRVFPTIYPDIYSGFAFGWLARTYLSIEVPMNIAGLSGRSNGMATLRMPEGQPIAIEFNELNHKFGYLPHPKVPDIPIETVPPMDSFEYARQFFFPDDNSFSYDRRSLAELYLATIPHEDAATRARYRTLIRATLSDRPDLQEWFDREAPHPPPVPWSMFRSAPLGFDGTSLRLDTTALGVTDIEGAVNLAAQLLGFGNEPIRYDLPTHHTMYQQQHATEQRASAAEAALTAEQKRFLQEREELTAALLQAQREGALRNIPRRIARKMLRTLRLR